jgi:cytochrome P450
MTTGHQRGAPEVAGFIAATVGDPGRPRVRIRPRRGLSHIPGESGLIAGMQNVAGWMRDGNAHLLAQIGRYGPIYQHRLGVVPGVCVAEPELIARITKNTEGIWSSALAWGIYLDGLDERSPTLDMPATLDFVPHTEARRLLQPAFSGAALAGYLEIAEDYFESAVERWVRTGRVRFKAEARRLFATVANRIFVGVEDAAESARLDQATTDFWRGFTAMSKRPWLSPTWRKSQRGYRVLRDTLRPRVAERRTGTGDDLFSRMCRTSDRVEWLDDDALVRLFLGVMAAAFDTTSLGVTSMAYALAIHPEWQERLAAEVSAAPANGDTVDRLKRLESLERAWKESLRLYPGAPTTPRMALRDTELGGFEIPAGTYIAPMIGAAMHDARYWTDPLAFDPDRFASERAEEKRGAYLPFGAGAHACIGAVLSTLEAKLFWSMLISRARITLTGPYVARHQYRPLGVVSGDVELSLQPR